MGRMASINQRASRELEKLRREHGIETCELRLPGCLKRMYVAPAHRHKRNWYKEGKFEHIELLWDYKQVIWACVGCHTNYEGLKAIYTPVPDSLKPTGGCSGEAIFYEPYDRVYISNIKDFQDNDPHGKMACTVCHGGVDNTVDKALAHSTEKGFLKKPTPQSIFHPTCFLAQPALPSI